MNGLTPEQAQQLLTMLGVTPNAGQQGGIGNVANQQQFVAQQALPVGCIAMRHDGVFIAESVKDLYTWENHVEAKDGGTYKGVMVHYIGTEATKKSEKSFSRREIWMARFEIARAGGRNPMNEVINIFMKDELAYRPYLNPKLWSASFEEVEFRSEDEAEPPRKFRVNLIRFDGELISDDTIRKCKHIASQIKGMYVPYVNGKELEGVVDHGE